MTIGQGKKIPSDDETWKKYFNQIESINILSNVLLLKNFYNPDIFTDKISF
ncbi:hypothetical protein [Candidatus Arthromitus sp. SFB-rat-Yit]|uniref:hypothetical protein n=1 Tax=Candidatus Arthromitus sp. SFB-rat-Yit TaxID=1041504 RepID=UPI0003076121|nr:hypothetical protein [Candidatus Arthromitus sp. SFB-rat-Yit]